MKKILKIAGRISLVILIILVLFLLVIFIYNKIMLKQEKPLREPLGQMVMVDGHNMSIYTKGEGAHTLVFMSGAGIPSPIIDYKSVYSLLSDDYRRVVVEKFGYGFSDVIDSERSLETILRQDREALSKAGIDGKLILCPHSMSGLEAILWAQIYPDEIEAIVGLDMSLPQTYNDDISGDSNSIDFYSILRETGLLRLGLSDSFLPDTLTQKEKDIYMALAFEKFSNKTANHEKQHIDEAVELINSNPKPDVPMLMFVSNGEDTGVENWGDIQKDYASELTNAKIIELDCGHMIHRVKQEQIAEDTREFIESLNG